jgi:hypothetical protein
MGSDDQGADSAASPSHQGALGKRKREGDDLDQAGEDATIQSNKEQSIFMPESDRHALVWRDHLVDEAMSSLPHRDEDELGQHAANEQMYTESTEAFPDCRIYDEGIPQLRALLTRIPQRVIKMLEPYNLNGNHVQTHMAAARELVGIPETKKLRIALIGNAGTGPYVLVNKDMQSLTNARQKLHAQCACRHIRPRQIGKQASG